MKRTVEDDLRRSVAFGEQPDVAVKTGMQTGEPVLDALAREGVGRRHPDLLLRRLKDGDER